MKNVILVTAVLLAAITISPALAQDEKADYSNDIMNISLAQQFDTATPGSDSMIAVSFALAKDWHFYADAETAPGQMNLKVIPKADAVTFGAPVMPASAPYYDEGLQKKLEVFSDKFTVYIPFKIENANPGKLDIELKIEGAVCSGALCRPNYIKLASSINIDPQAVMGKPAFTVPDKTADLTGSASYSVPVAFAIAIIAGLIMNVMPCVWPVLPIIIMRLLNLAGEKKSKAIAMGGAFCVGIISFFAIIAIANIVLRLGYGVVFQWGDHFRNPLFVTGMTLLMVVLGLFMFGVFNIGMPASITGKATSTGGGIAGGIGMGFLAALLATPCSFAILAAAFAWAQTQPLPMATVTIMLIGVGMAIPYMILVSVPKLLDKMPRAGGWMDHIKHGMGFLLLLIAAKLLGAIPSESRIDVLFYAVVLSACIWMWGCLVSYSTPKKRKYTIRIIAAVLAVSTGYIFLPIQNASKDLVEWQKYDRKVIAEYVEQNKPVLIKFTADWCTSCTVVDRLVFKRKDVADMIKQKDVLTIKGDTTLLGTDATVDLANKYKQPGVPVTVVIMPDGTEHHLPGLIGKKDVLEIIEKLPDDPKL
ncbi:MAG: thioredoxin family protein [Planctomycetes bacterium]|nr:thioredoxin family protein [Planctomycetota bacterium]